MRSRVRREARFLLALRLLPLRVAHFQWRARRMAFTLGDEFSLLSATQPGKLSTLLDLAAGRRTIVELGTATGWTTLSLLIADPERTVVSLDPVSHPDRQTYLTLVDAAVRERARFVQLGGEAGPAEAGMPPGSVELLYIDSVHSRESTRAEWEAWQPALTPDALVVFDDYGHPDFPGVRQAIGELRLPGAETAGLFVHHAQR